MECGAGVTVSQIDPLLHSSKEHTKVPDQGASSVIVIGASAGGRAGIGTVLKDLSHDIPLPSS
jgi:chemotaxis response regulator CheB